MARCAAVGRCLRHLAFGACRPASPVSVYFGRQAARAKRNEAKAALLRIATNQERFYLNNNTYTNDMTQLGFPVSDDFVSDTGSYVIDVSGANASNFSALATYTKVDNESTKCLTLGIDGRGAS